MLIFRNLFVFLAGLAVHDSSVLQTVQARPSSVAPAMLVNPDGIHSVTNCGAVGDGVTTNTAAIQTAINATSAAGGGTVEVPAGVFLSGPIHLASRINLRVDGGATLRMLPLDQYPGSTIAPANFISGAGLHDIAISGSGTMGQGIPRWPYVRRQDARRPRMIDLPSRTGRVAPDSRLGAV